MKRTCILLFLLAALAAGLSAQTRLVSVADTSFSVPGKAETVFYFQFAKGDRMVYAYESEKGKELKEVEVAEMPDITRYLDYESSRIEKTFDVSRTVIFRFRFRNSAGSSRNCHLRISRQPGTVATQDFVTRVEPWQLGDTTARAEQARLLLQKARKTVVVLEPQNYCLSSTSHAVLKGTPSKTALSIELPLHTVEWQYRYVVGKAVDSTRTDFNGTETCDIYLLDGQHLDRFRNDAVFPFFENGLQVNSHSGAIKLEPFQKHQLYLGLVNPNSIQGICIRLEVTAVVEELAGTQ